MKKFLLSCAAVAMAMTVNAQLYVVGAAEGLAWDPANPVVVDDAGGKYTVELKNASDIKISTTMGDWDAFNAGAVCIDGDFNAPGTYNLIPGDANITFPWAGDWKLVADTDLTSVEITTTTPKPEGPAVIYLRGSWDESWSADESRKFEYVDGLYILADVDCTDKEFKIADANWGAINYGCGELYLDEETELIKGGDNMYFAEGEDASCVTFKFNLEDKILVCTAGGAGVEAVAVENAPAVYYNLQGVRVANPTNGLYIVRQGNKVSKVVK